MRTCSLTTMRRCEFSAQSFGKPIGVLEFELTSSWALWMWIWIPWDVRDIAPAAATPVYIYSIIDIID